MRYLEVYVRVSYSKDSSESMVLPVVRHIAPYIPGKTPYWVIGSIHDHAAIVTAEDLGEIIDSAIRQVGIGCIDSLLVYPLPAYDGSEGRDECDEQEEPNA